MDNQKLKLYPKADPADELVLNEKGNLHDNVAQLEWFPIRPGSLRLKVGISDETTVDNGHGKIKPTDLIRLGTIDYQTGILVLASKDNVLATASYHATYLFNSSAIVTKPVEFNLELARTRRMARNKTTDSAPSTWEGQYPLKIISTPIKALAKKYILKPRRPTGPDPIDPKQYFDHCGVAYNEEGARRVGYLCIPVLQFTWGRRLDETIMAYVHSLRPSLVRITEGDMTADSRPWRVTILVRKEHRLWFVRDIRQEIKVLLPKGVAHGAALKIALRNGIKSPEVEWHQDATGYQLDRSGYYKTTAKGKTIRWQFKAKPKNPEIWAKNLALGLTLDE